MAAGLGRRRAGWRGLGLFWAAILIIAGAGAAILQVLGPPAPPPPVVAEKAPAEPVSPPSPPRPDRIPPPQAALLEPSKTSPPLMLPRVGPDGSVARVVYARPFDRADKRPRIALLVTGFGMSDADSRAAISTLPGPVTLAFSPYASNPDPLLELCRSAGHETLISIPMEPQGYPLNDAGSHSLLAGAASAQNQANLDWALSRIQGYVGATGAMDGMRGERFADQAIGFEKLLDEVKRRGLLYVDPRPGRGGEKLAAVPGRAVDLVIDDPPARAEIEAKLAALERLAREKGSALGLAGPLRPVTVERLAVWARGLGDRGIALAPVSALVDGAGR